MLTTLTSLATLVAFAAVSLNVVIRRGSHSEIPRAYRAPLYSLLPLASIAFCLYLAFSLPAITFLMFALWLADA